MGRTRDIVFSSQFFPLPSLDNITISARITANGRGVEAITYGMSSGQYSFKTKYVKDFDNGTVTTHYLMGDKPFKPRGKGSNRPRSIYRMPQTIRDIFALPTNNEDMMGSEIISKMKEMYDEMYVEQS
jgi:hypothetical protein